MIGCASAQEVPSKSNRRDLAQLNISKTALLWGAVQPAPHSTPNTPSQCASLLMNVSIMWWELLELSPILYKGAALHSSMFLLLPSHRPHAT